MTRRTVVLAVLYGLSCSLNSLRADDAAKLARVLFVTESQGFRHGSVTRPEGQLAPAEIALVQLGEQTGLFRADCTQNSAADLTRDNLQNYDIVAFYTTGTLPVGESDLAYFFDEWLRQP